MRLKTLEAAEVLFMEEMPLVPVYHWKNAFMLKPYITNTRVLPNGGFDYTRLAIDEKAHES
jgi:ABC-type oligopeptide transport system substrate-binding subunit